MNYKSGDKVKLLPYKELEKIIENRISFRNKNKLKYAGQVVTIAKIEDYGRYEQYYTMNEVGTGEGTLAFTDDMIEGYAVEYENFSVKGSRNQIIAFKEAVEEIGWKLEIFNVKTDENLMFFETKVKCCNFSHTTSTEKIFVLPTEFTAALTYAKEAFDSINTPKFVKYVSNTNAGTPGYWNFGEVYQVKNTTNSGYYTINHKGEENVWQKVLFIPATEKEYQDFIDSIKEVTFCYAGKVWAIKNGVAKSEEHSFTLADSEKVIKYLRNPPTINGYTMAFDIDTIVCFGCHKDKIEKVFEFHQLLKESSK